MDFPICCMLFSLALWLTLAVTNNMKDPVTNHILIGRVLSMQLIEDDGQLGQGLLTRRWCCPAAPPVILRMIIAVQVLIALGLWFSACCRVMAMMDLTSHAFALKCSDVVLSLFLLLWWSFMCGGLWFGYWIKMFRVHIIHMTLVVIGLLTLILTHLPN